MTFVVTNKELWATFSWERSHFKKLPWNFADHLALDIFPSTAKHDVLNGESLKTKLSRTLLLFTIDRKTDPHVRLSGSRASQLLNSTPKLIYFIIWQTQSLCKSLCSDWFFLGQDFAVRTVSVETVQSVYFCFEAKPANSKFETKTAKKKFEYCHSSHWNY